MTEELDEAQWFDRYQPLVERCFASFREMDNWPSFESLQRSLDRERVPIDLAIAYQQMPLLPGEPRAFHPSYFSIPLRILARLPEALPFVDACIIIVQYAVRVYLSEVEPAVISSDDSPLREAVPDPVVLSKAGILISNDYPTPLGGGSSGERQWQLFVNGQMARQFIDVDSTDAYFTRQLEIRLKTFQDVPGSPRQYLAFVAMPFGEDWSPGVYDLVQRAVEAVHDEFDIIAYRADEISRPGKITDQIVASIDEADLMIADVSSMNPNVLWELGYAYKAGIPAVILNQDIEQSPFDLRDWRQVSYSLTPTAMDQRKISELIRAALRVAEGRP